MRSLSDMFERPALIAATIALLLVALLGVQYAAQSVAPPGGVSSAGRTIGQAGFAYLGGLRTFAAAALWNHLEPQFHKYYRTTKVRDLTYLLPSLYLVQKLDPQFIQAYYNASFILAQRGAWDEAYRIADQGIASNPRSGLMRANYVQLLLYQDKKANLDKALKQAVIGLGPNMVYANADDEFESLGIFRAVFRLIGRTDIVAAIDRRQAELRAAGASPTGLAHDHDADGTPDH